MLTTKRACEQLQKFWEHEQASTRLNLANKSSKGKILRAVKNFNGPFITPCFDLNSNGAALAQDHANYVLDNGLKFHH